uniref:RNA-directed DNA polymerase n=3 Tax=Lygus hesperus TaxID=30085 RepID=A0A146MG21_LYGHE
MKDSNARVMRWSLMLEEYAYTPRYKTGKTNTNADGLSRAYTVQVLERDELVAEQAKDSYCIQVEQQTNFTYTADGILAKRTEKGLRLVIPPPLRTRVLQLSHAAPQGGHCGQRKTLQAVKSKYYWPDMTTDVISFVRACPQCALLYDHGRTKPPLGQFYEPRETFEAISVDVVGPLPPTKEGHKYILTIIDQFSRYVQFYPMRSQTAEEVAHNLVRHMARFGTSKRMLSDQGKNFTSELIRHLCEFFQVDKLQTTAYHPAGNGRCERVHRTMGKILAHFVNDTQTDWDLKLPLAELVVNSHCNETTTYPPFTVVFGKDMPLPARDDLTLQPSIEPYALHVEDLRATLLELWDAVDRMQAQNQDKIRKRYNQGKEDPGYSIGDFVYLHSPAVKKGKARKLTKPWGGPYEILEVHSPQNVTLKVGSKETRVHTSRLKPVRNGAPDLANEPPGETRDQLGETASPSGSSLPSDNPRPNTAGEPLEPSPGPTASSCAAEPVPSTSGLGNTPNPFPSRNTNRYQLRSLPHTDYRKLGGL